MRHLDMLLLVQVSGLAALIGSYAALVVGLAGGIRWPRRSWWPGSRRFWIARHRQAALAALALVAVHLVAFALSPGGSVTVALVPQTAPVGAAGYTAGVVAWWLALLLGPSYHLRDRIGRRTWLVLHQFAAVTYAISLWHALVLGGDLRFEGPARTALVLLQLPLLALFGLRLTRPRRPVDELDVDRRPERFGTGRPRGCGAARGGRGRSGRCRRALRAAGRGRPGRLAAQRVMMVG